MTRHALALGLIASLAACAQSPDAIAPAILPAGSYDALTCDAAMTERLILATSIDTLSRQQRDAVAGDALGVLIFGVPLSSLSGGDKAGLLAVEKGKALALDARLRRC